MPDAASPVFNFTKLVVADLEQAATFYKTVFGFQEWQRVEAEIEGRALKEVIFQPLAEGQPSLVLLHFVDSPSARDGEVILGFTVKGIDGVFDRVTAAGGKVSVPVHPAEDHGILVGFVRDIEGHLLEIVELL